jgi:PPM family protein phosphatase
MKIRPGVEFASLSDVGCTRAKNEDSYGYWEAESDLVFERLGRLAIIADGMGGHEGGQIASRMAVEIVGQIYAGSNQTDPQQALLQAFAEAHQRIQKRARENPGLHAMGTTCTGFALVGRTLSFAHLGDSRLYLLRDNRLRLLTRDHTLVARWLESGAIRPEDVENHPQRHVLTAALGVAEDVPPDFPPQPLATESGDVLLVCTDGLWGQLSSSEIQTILSCQPAASACRSLVELAKDRGGPDNITVEIMRILDPPPRPL